MGLFIMPISSAGHFQNTSRPYTWSTFSLYQHSMNVLDNEQNSFSKTSSIIFHEFNHAVFLTI